MSYTGINLGNVKNNNRNAILKLLNDQCAMSRKDIATALGLTPAAVTVICSDLISSQILTVLGEAQEGRRAGRRKILLGINYNRYHVISISIESQETCLSVTNLKGENGVFRRIATDTSVPPPQFLRRVAEALLLMLEETDIPRSSVLGTGVSVPGIVNRKEGISVSAYRIWDSPVHIESCLQEILHMPVIVENNVRAFAEAELIYGSGKNLENMLFIRWGPGVDSSIVIHRQIYGSNRSRNAEIGHMVMDRQGRLCRCGRRGCLETFVGTHAMAEQIRDGFSAQAMPDLYQRMEGDVSRITARNFPQVLQGTDPAMWDIIQKNVSMLACSVCNMITMLVPDCVILYGKLFEEPELHNRFLAYCQSIDSRYDGDYIVRSGLQDRMDFIGPLAVVVNQLFLSGFNG